MGAVLLAFWAVVVAWAAAVAMISFFVVGAHFPDRGASPVAGARVTFFSGEHRRQLREYREDCLARGKTLFWWRFVRSFVVAFPFLIVIVKLVGHSLIELPSPNNALQRTRSAPLRSPLSFGTLGGKA
jgi:hypothetical protein